MNKKDTRLGFALSAELEDRIFALRAQKEFRRCSISEIIRRLIEVGLDEANKDDLFRQG